MAFDSGVLLELLSGSEEGKRVERFVEDNLDEIVVNELNLEEVKYIVCRKAGEGKALEVIETLKSSGYFTLIPFSQVSGEVYKIKCKYPISLADVTTIATAKAFGLKALFRRKRGWSPLRPSWM